MTVFSAAVIACSLLGGMNEPPAGPPGGGVAPETRVEPSRPEDVPGFRGRLLLGLRLVGPRFKVQGEGTRERPLIIDLPVGDLFKLRFVLLKVRGALPPAGSYRDGNLYY